MDEFDGDHIGLDPFTTYLEEVREVCKLSGEREKYLGRVIIEGRKAADRLREGAKCLELEQQLHCGLEAEKELISAHLPLVVSKAKKFRTKVPGVDIQDLVQAGNEGLVRAIKKFEPRNGARFSTYASHWILKLMVEEYITSRWMIRMPDRAMRRISQKNKIIGRFIDVKGRDPAFEELVEYILVRNNLYGELSKEGFMGRDQAEAFLRTAVAAEEEVGSLDTMVGDDLSTPLADLIADKRLQRLMILLKMCSALKIYRKACHI